LDWGFLMDQDIFVSAVSQEKMSSTNEFWNTMKLNNQWIVGQVSGIIQQKEFKNKEEWKDYYFNSGKKRLELISELEKRDKAALKSIELKDFYKTSSRTLHSLNTQHGRTEKELDEIGDVLYGAVRLTGNPLNISRYECRYMVKHRVIADTWNGLIKRERNTMKTLRAMFGKGYDVIKTDGDVDIRYEVDAEIYHEGKRVAGIQIKPQSYTKQFQGNQSTYDINEKKNTNYEKTFGCPVFYVFSDISGRIHNADVFQEIINTKDLVSVD